MGRMTIILPDDIEDRFRRACIEKFGLKRGKVYNGFREAIKLFIKSVEGDKYKEIILEENTPGQEPEKIKQVTQKEFTPPPVLESAPIATIQNASIEIKDLLTVPNDFQKLYNKMPREELVKEFGSLTVNDPLYSLKTQHIAKRLTELITTNNISAPKHIIKKPDSEYL